MVVDAIQLLSEREIIHPSRIVSANLADREFRLSLVGYPWWREAGTHDEDQISFRFSGVARGQLNLFPLFDYGEIEWLECFKISPTATLDWAKPDQFLIYCSAPLVNPLAVYSVVENYIVASRADRTVGDYLNGADRMSRFLEFTGSGGYLLATVPDVIRGPVVRELQAQSVPHTVVKTKVHPEARLFVRLEGSAFYCETAVAEFD
jgi:hypothetical protein